MALTITDRGETDNGSADHVDSASFTPANGSLLIAWGFMWDTNNSGSRWVPTDSFADTGGGSWTLIAANDLAFGAFAATLSMRAYYRRIGTSPGAHVVTAHGNTGAPDNIMLSVQEVAGAYTTPVPTGQAVSVVDSAGTVTNALPVTPDAASAVFTGCIDVLGSSAPALPSGYTSVEGSSPYGDGVRLAYKNGSTATTTTYAGLETTQKNLGLAFEISAVPTTAIPGFTITDNIPDSGGGAWTKVTGTAADGAEIAVWYRRLGAPIAPATTLTGKVTATAAVSSPGRELTVLEMAHRNTDNPVPTGQAVAASGTAAALTATMPAPPASDSVIVAGAISRGDSSAPGIPAGHIASENASTGGDGYEAGYQPAGAGAAAAYSGLATTRNLAVIAEIRKIGSGTGGGGGAYFTATSPWNTPVAAGSSFTDEPALHGHGWIETEQYGVPVIRSSVADPIMTVSGWSAGSWGWPETSVQVHCPTTGLGATGTDGSMCVVEPAAMNGYPALEVYDFWQFHRTSGSTGTASSYAHTNSVTGTGWSLDGSHGAGIHAAGSSCLAGLIMNNELSAGINHGLAIACRYDLVQPWPNFVAPAISADGSGGPLTEGSRVAIPPGVAMPAGMSLQEQNLWKAAQKFGCFIIDVCGGTQNVQFWGDGNSVPQSDIDGLINPSTFATPGMDAITNALRIVR